MPDAVPDFTPSPELLCVLDADGVIRRANPAWTPILGWAEAELVGRRFAELVHPAEADALGSHLAVLAEAGPPARAEVRFQRRGGGYRQVEWSALLRGGWLFAVGRDVTRRWQRTRALEADNVRLARRVETFDAHRRDLHLLRELGAMLRSAAGPSEAAEVVVEHAARLFPGFAASLYRRADDGDGFERVGVGSAAGPLELHSEDCWAVRRARIHQRPPGAFRLVCSHLSGTGAHGSACLPLVQNGEVVGLLVLSGVGSGEPIEPPSDDLLEAVADRVTTAMAMLRLREALRRSSTQDELTRIHNRRFLQLSLHREAARAARAGEAISAMVLELDPLRRVGQAFGHGAVHEVLRQVAWMLSATFRAEDIVCRWSEEEFAVLLPGAGAAEAVERAEQVRRAIEATEFVHRDRPLGRVTATIGVAECVPGGAVDELFPRVEVALQRARRGGRNSVESWAPDIGSLPAIAAVQLR